jgi:hypothetical protein
MSAIIDLLKIVALLAVLVAVVRYAIIQGLPARGKGRWRKVLNELSGRRERHNLER